VAGDRSFLLLHGFSHHRLPEHWQYRLAHGLRARGERVLYPGLPFEDEPAYPEWREALEWSLAQMGTPARVVVCNSLACLLWMGYAGEATRGEAPGTPVDRLLLVSPPDPASIPEAAASFRAFALDGDAVRASSRARIRIACSEADPYNPAGGGTMYAEAIGADVDLVPGAGHIGPADGYGTWPAVEAWCLDGRARLVARGAA
jgi:uncharacterized protein